MAGACARRFGEAEPLLLRAATLLDSAAPPTDAARQEVTRAIASLYRAWNREADALRYEALLEGEAPSE